MQKKHVLCIVELPVTGSNEKKIKCFTTIHLWRIYVPGNNKAYSELYVKCQAVLSDFNQMWIFSTDIHKIPQFQILRISVQREAFCGQTDRLTEK
jgi:hypothetical protein